MKQHYKNVSLDNIQEIIDNELIIEKWSDVIGYNGLYMISTFGRVKSLFRYAKCLNGVRPIKEKIVKPFVTPKGYIRVGLSKNGKSLNHSIHILVAKSFIENPFNLEGVNHNNYIKHDNYVDNLKWMTNIDNAKDAWEKDKVPYQVGFDASNVTFSREEVYDIYHSNLSVSDLSKKYNRPYMTIYCIKAGKVFKEITGGVSKINKKHTRTSKEIISICLQDIPVDELSKQTGISKEKIWNIRYYHKNK